MLTLLGAGGGIGPVNPATLSGVVASYDFVQTGNASTTLTDRSGNGNDGTFGLGGTTFNPAYSSTGVSFSGQKLIALPAGVVWDGTGSVVVWADVAPQPTMGGPVVGYHFGNPGGVAVQVTDGRPGLALTGQGDPLVCPARRTGNGVGFLAATGGAAPKFYVDAVESSPYWKAPAAWTPSGGALTVWLGSSNGGGNGWYQGTMYYAAFFNRVLTPAEVVGLGLFVKPILLARGVSSVGLPAVAAATRRLIFLGDSITRGYTSGNGGYPELIRSGGSLSHAYSLTNLGIGGIASADVQGQVSMVAALLADAPAAQNCVHIAIGSNDGFDPVTAYAALVATTTALKALANPPKIVMTTGLPRTGTDAHRATWNAQVASKSGGLQWDALADYAGDPNMGQNGQNSNATYYSDTLHPTDASGYPIMTAISVTAINSLG